MNIQEQIKVCIDNTKPFAENGTEETYEFIAEVIIYKLKAIREEAQHFDTGVDAREFYESEIDEFIKELKG